MKIEQFEVEGLAQYSYAISDGGEMAVIDPERDVEPYLRYAKAEGVRITSVLETHIHADFAAGSVALAERSGGELALSGYDAGERYVYAMPHRRLMDGDAVQVGGLRLQALHTPGHTPEHVSFLLRDASGVLVGMFSGDFLFAGALGRPDLLGEAAKLGLARELHRSVTERIAQLPDALPIYPGHGAGSLCGAGLSQRSETTLGFERQHNPFFGYAEAEFVERTLASVPPMPTYYPRMKAFNAAGAPVLGVLPGGRELSVAEVVAMRNKVTLLDVRSVEAFAKDHVAGAVSLGVEGNLSMWAGWLLDPSLPIVLIGDGRDQKAARLALVRVGLDTLAGHLAGGMAAWKAADQPTISLELLPVTELTPPTALLLDVRKEQERLTGEIPGSLPIPLGDLMSALETLPKDRPIVTVCESGYRASAAASLLQRNGFEQVSMLRGGMADWRESVKPMTA
jgi:hydroxyacylglutathione hydrolase